MYGGHIKTVYSKHFSIPPLLTELFAEINSGALDSYYAICKHVRNLLSDPEVISGFSKAKVFKFFNNNAFVNLASLHSITISFL